ncbi:hypothetical protein [Zavarzinia sp.]|uniref:hypothetical protein n=1 Tax=Zavarzinia sp. TaxID=2027920 RepID=UPI00356B48F3
MSYAAHHRPGIYREGAAVAPTYRERQLVDLLLALNRPANRDRYGFLQRDTARIELGLSELEMDVLLRTARQRGLIETQSGYDQLSLTPRALQKIASLWS